MATYSLSDRARAIREQQDNQDLLDPTTFNQVPSKSARKSGNVGSNISFGEVSGLDVAAVIDDGASGITVYFEEHLEAALEEALETAAQDGRYSVALLRTVDGRGSKQTIVYGVPVAEQLDGTAIAS